MVNPDDPDVSNLCSPQALECIDIMRKMMNEEHSFAQGAELAGMDAWALWGGQRIAMLEMGSWGIINSVEGTSDSEGKELYMAVQKRRKSSAKRDMRRAQWMKSVKTPSVTTCPRCQAPKAPHHVCLECGYYDGEKVLEVEESE